MATRYWIAFLPTSKAIEYSMIGNGTELEQVLHRKAAVGQEGLVLSSPCTAFYQALSVNSPR